MKRITFCFTISLLLWGGVCFGQELKEPKFDWKDNGDFSYKLSELINQKEKAVKNNDDENYNDDYVVVKIAGKYGVYNDDKKSFFTEAIYDSITPAGNTLRDKKWGNLLYGNVVSELLAEHPSGIVFIKNGKQGLKSIAGKTVAGAKYDEVKPTGNNWIFLLRKDDKWGFANVNAGKVVKPQYDYIICETSFELATYIAAYKNKVVTKYTIKGEIINPDKKKEAVKEYPGSDFLYGDSNSILENGGLLFSINGKYGVEDSNGKEVLPPVYSAIRTSGKDALIVSKDSLDGVLDNHGTTIIPVKYKNIADWKMFSPTTGFYFVQDALTKLYGIFDKAGKQIYPFTIKPAEYQGYDTQRYIDKSMWVIENETTTNNNNSYGKTETVSLLKFENDSITKVLSNCYSISFFSDNSLNKIVRYANDKNLTGFYNLETGTQLPPAYKQIHSYNNDKILATTTEGTYELIDRDFKITKLPLPVVVYSKGYLTAKGAGGMQVMDEAGTISTFTYPLIEHFNVISGEGPDAKKYTTQLFKFYTSSQRKKPGIITAKGEIIVPANKYDVVTLSLTSDATSGVNNDKAIAIKEYLNKILVCRNYQTNNQISDVDLILGTKKIASFTISSGWWLLYTDISNNGQLILKTKDSVKLYNLTTQKYDLVIKAGNFIENADGSFTNMIYDANKDNTKMLLTKYSKKGTFISENLVDKDKAYSYFGNRNEYIAKRNGRYGLINSDEKILLPFVNDSLYTYRDQPYFAKRNGKYGVLSSEGTVLLPFKYDAITIQTTPNHNGNPDYVYFARQDTRYGVLNKKPEQVIPLVYDTLTINYDGIIAKKDGVYTVFDFNGTARFSKECGLLEFKDGYYNFYIGGKQGIVSGNGKEVIQPMYEKAAVITNNYILIYKDGKQYVANYSGKLMLPFPVKSFKERQSKNRIYDIEKEFYIVENYENRFGLFDLGLKQLLPFEYDTIREIEALQYIIATKNDMEGVVDINGKIIVPFIYRDVDYSENGEYFRASAEKTDYKIAPSGIILEEEINN